MDMGKSILKILQFLKDNFKMVKNLEKEILNFQMVHNMKVNLTITIFQVKGIYIY